MEDHAFHCATRETPWRSRLCAREWWQARFKRLMSGRLLIFIRYGGAWSLVRPLAGTAVANESPERCPWVPLGCAASVSQVLVAFNARVGGRHTSLHRPGRHRLEATCQSSWLPLLEECRSPAPGWRFEVDFLTFCSKGVRR